MTGVYSLSQWLPLGLRTVRPGCSTTALSADSLNALCRAAAVPPEGLMEICSSSLGVRAVFVVTRSQPGIACFVLGVLHTVAYRPFVYNPFPFPRFCFRANLATKPNSSRRSAGPVQGLRLIRGPSLWVSREQGSEGGGQQAGATERSG